MSKNNPIMRKIIITVIATILMVSEAQGQVFPGFDGRLKWEASSVDGKNFPGTNFSLGIDGKVSAQIWRAEPFLRSSFHAQVLEENMSLSHWTNVYESPWTKFYGTGKSNFGSGSLPIVWANTFGLDFRVVGNNFIRIQTQGRGVSGSLNANRRGRVNSVGITRRQPLGDNTSLDFHLLHGRGGDNFSGQSVFSLYALYQDGSRMVETDRRETESVPVVLHNNITEAGATLRHDIGRNIALTASATFTNTTTRSGGLTVPEVDLDEDFTGMSRNLFTVSVGVHKTLQIGTPQVEVQRRDRRRTTFQAMPCPGNQMNRMRHNRSWDRPSSVFNHPSGR